MSYAGHVSRKKTPQSIAIPGREKEMKKNAAGGVTFTVDDWTRLDRFLILGNEGGTYYASEQKLTRENAAVIERCLKLDGLRTVARIAEVSEQGLAPKNDPSIFALALAATVGDLQTRQRAFSCVSAVCRTGTHLYQFADAVQQLRGWGRAAKRGFASWFLNLSVEKLAYQAVKYRQRNGWKYRDLLRLSHVETSDVSRRAVLSWMLNPENLSNGKVYVGPRLRGEDGKIVKPKDGGGPEEYWAKIPEIVQKHVQAMAGGKDYDPKLPWEAFPSEVHGDKKFWAALAPTMPIMALVRNLGRLTANGTLEAGNDVTRAVVARLKDPVAIRQSKIHPYSVLLAATTYETGQGFRGGLSWKPIQKIKDALEEAFDLSFQNVVPTGKRIMVTIDCSPSMGSAIIGNGPLNARQAAAAVAQLFARTETDCDVYGFAGGGRRGTPSLVPLQIGAKTDLPSAVKATERADWGGTDASIPFTHAAANDLKYDAFILITDNETWSGVIQPTQALAAYRKKSGINAKMALLSMTATRSTIADPQDAGQMEFVGFDASAPRVLCDWLREGAADASDDAPDSADDASEG